MEEDVARVRWLDFVSHLGAGSGLLTFPVRIPRIVIATETESNFAQDDSVGSCFGTTSRPLRRRALRFSGPAYAYRPRSSKVGLQLPRPSETQHVTVVVDHLKCAQAVLGVCQALVHRNGPADVLFVQQVGVGGMDVGVPARPFVARMVRLRMNLRSNCLEAHHHTVPPDERPEIIFVAVPIASTLVRNFKAELGLVEVEARLKILDNKARNNSVESSHGPMVARVPEAIRATARFGTSHLPKAGRT